MPRKVEIVNRILATLLLLGAVAGSHVEWSRGWVIAFHNSKVKPVHVVVLSDSTAHVDQTNGIGYGPNRRANLWPNQLQMALAKAAPGGSSGTGLVTLEANAGRYDTDVWRVSGRYAYRSSIGPFQDSLDQGGYVPPNGGTVHLAAGEEAALSSQRGDTLWLYWASCPDSTAFTVDVDDAPSGTFGADRAPSCIAKRTRVYTGPLGEHTVTIKAGEGSAYLYAAEWTVGDAGVAVDNLAVGGATTTFFNSPSKLAYLHSVPNIGLVIIALGINDFAHDVPLATYESNLAAIIIYFKKSSPHTSILIVSQYPVLSDTAQNSLKLAQAQYSRSAQQIAFRYKVGYLNLGDAWGSFSTIENRGLLTQDRVHPSDLGGGQFSQEIQQVIIDKLGLRPSGLL